MTSRDDIGIYNFLRPLCRAITSVIVDLGFGYYPRVCYLIEELLTADRR